MTEQKTKNRGWVKNAAIIFLSVLLVLTFFSETIMNRSLPEVATSYVQSGTITTKIRGQGTVEAVETYSVISESTRKVKSVLIKTGQEVSVGDVLFTLEEGDSTELETAKAALKSLREELETMEYNYQVALIKSSSADYTSQNVQIQRARETLERAVADRDKLAVTDAELDAAQAKTDAAAEVVTAAEEAVAAAEAELDTANAGIETANAAVDAANAAVEAEQEKVNAKQETADEAKKALDAAKEELASVSGGTSSSSYNSAYSQMKAKEQSIADAKEQLEIDKLIYGADYDALKSEAETQIKATAEYTALTDESAKTKLIESKRNIYMAAIAEQAGSSSAYYKAYTAITDDEQVIRTAQAAYDTAEAEYYDLIADDNSYYYSKYSKKVKETAAVYDAAYAEVIAAEKLVTAADKNVTAAKKDVTAAEKVAEKAKAAVTAAEEKLTEVKAAKTEADAELKALKTKQDEYDAAYSSISSAQDALEDLVLALNKEKTSDSQNAALSELEFENMRGDISDKQAEVAAQQEKVDKLSGGDGEAEICSPVSGVVKSVSVSAGETAESNAAIATIEVPDRGYRTTLTVTTEQSKKVSIGDRAEVSSYWWSSSNVNAVLTSIRNDTADPKKNKQLVFEVSGDVASGDSISLAVAQHSQSYDLLVPNSALRSDTNGSFVLMITAKASPLGNRYIATRVDVKVLDSDDNFTAVSGGLSSWDYVITTSSAPIEAGTQVRLADSI